MSTPENKSYRSAGVSSFSPWSSRSGTPKPRESDEQASEAGAEPQRGGDHTVSHRHRLSLKNYPRDCPPLVVQWFHAIDIPKRKPLPSGQLPVPADAPRPTPKKWAQFSPGDSKAIETAFQKFADETDAADTQARGRETLGSPLFRQQEQRTGTESSRKWKVPVNEDYLFDVDIETRELAPAYWLGPVYDIRRGTWFFYDGPSLKPCDENLSTQLEEGYLKLKPWRFSQQDKRSASQPRSRPTSMKVAEDIQREIHQPRSNPITPRSSSETLRADVPSPGVESLGDDNAEVSPSQDQPRTLRLFGAHMNSIVTYQNDTTAWLLTDDLFSRMSSTVYQRFAGGGHFAGVKIVRGYIDPSRKKEGKDDDGPGTSGSTSSSERPDDRKTDQSPNVPTEVPKFSRNLEVPNSPLGEDHDGAKSPFEARRKTLERHMSSLVVSLQPEDPEQREEEIRKRDEKEIRDDYKDQTSDEQGREIEHLLLVTHGIGQRLGMRLESVNFVHDVNTMRKTMKRIYATSADLQALNSEVDKMPKNCRIQVLPICWRHLLDFPKQSLKHNHKEHDLGDLDFEEQDYPTLDDITVEGVPAVRNLITDLALDILLYQSPAYKGHISRIVLQECNRIYRLFKERNPTFNGKVSLVGHSLGSAIMFDILCHQREELAEKHRNKHRRSTEDSLRLDFDVEDFYALGSPVGLFQMLKGRTIAARPSNSYVPAKTPSNEAFDDPFISPAGIGHSSANMFEVATSSPRCKQLFNIFHPTDPIAYRIEPLISPAMSTLKPQPLPYTKKGIFGAPVGQGLTGIGARVGQSVSGLWTSFSSGIASSILNRSLGITEDATKLSSNQTQAQPTSRPISVGAGTNIGAGVVSSGSDLDMAYTNEEKKRRLSEETIGPGDFGEHPPTLIDSEIETLYAGFEKRRKSGQGEGDKDMSRGLEWQESEERSRKLRREEAKIRSLNSNGRVDYSIQEGAFDISVIASIASHLSYWQDEDVSHFVISQLLARHRVLKRNRGASDVNV
ncbi:DDHD-domain-containing protein [Lepidopterella palustris CBS 459.81]|uniref:DDHD-domain-containing protein n=1 Tax=Lepidopterella palustris CBS 459.81 TaxID=1314670 RepID=A0A8E2JDZ4_9PEZI|nr:DDHD-domain-containing protein [Lepidopterella palustris CBS 459.81]